MKYATAADIRAEFERDFEARWPNLAELNKDHELFVRWIQNWLSSHGIDEEDLSKALWSGSDAWFGTLLALSQF